MSIESYSAPRDRRSLSWAIAISFIVALALTALPMPPWAVLWRPAWVAVTLAYWCIALPDRVGILAAWLVGLFLDVLAGTLLGQHGLALSVLAYLASRVHRQVRVAPPWQQAITMFGLLLVYQAIVMWINGMSGLRVSALGFVGPPLVSALLWPWAFIVLRDVLRRYGREEDQ